nr:hypothetical protein [Actinomycetota bacterium]
GYLLDFDYFTQEQTTAISVDEVLGRFDRFHEVLFDFFCWCLSEDYLAALQSANASEGVTQ